ncbi:MFS transporter [Streptomyces sp. NPDC093108]|uniref:MFS transporter n=1 Tax=Streptomyces sp. NPDC093108 TaxID=3366030 RepID=UPI00380015B2
MQTGNLEDTSTSPKRNTRALLGAVFVTSIGDGLVLPFIFLYLTQVRDYSSTASGLVIGLSWVAQAVTTQYVGRVIERVDARKLTAAFLLLAGSGWSIYTIPGNAGIALIAAACAGAGSGGYWPGISFLMTKHSHRSERHRVWGTRQVMLNVGIGAGGVIGGYTIAMSSGGGYEIVIWLNSLTFVACASLVMFISQTGIRKPIPKSTTEEDSPNGWYAEILRDFPLKFSLLCTFVYTLAGLSLFQILSLYVVTESNLSSVGVGQLFLVNTAAVAIFQIPISRLAEGRSRPGFLASAMLLGGVAWGSFPLISRIFHGNVALLVFGLAVFVFAISECLQAVVQDPLTIDLAGSHSLGAVIASMKLARTLAFCIGPVLAGAAQDLGPAIPWIASGGMLILCGGMIIKYRNRIPGPVRFTPVPQADHP